jgi:hypothetical protein
MTSVPLPDPVTGRTGASGVADRAMTSAPGWQPGDRLTLTAAACEVIVQAVCCPGPTSSALEWTRVPWVEAPAMASSAGVKCEHP